jgi:M6 family metalloprotease-like protein
MYPLLLGIVLALFGLAVQVSSAQAAPAAPIDIPMTQPDGTTFTARQWGDEWLHGYETSAGYTIVMAEDGTWVYAEVSADGALAPVLQDGAPLKVGQDAPPDQARGARPALPPGSPALEIERGAPRGQNIGTQRLLLVMVNFANRAKTYTNAYFQDKAFGASNSIRDFYRDSSFNQLTLEPAAESQGTANDGLVEVTLLINHPSDTNQSRTIATAVYNAINPSINFANFDTDGDGYVTSTELHLVFIIAGYEESYGGCINPCIWAHQWFLESPLTLDGKNVGTNSADGDYGGYSMFGEIHSNHPAQVGIMVHELGHNLSWPDLYDTVGNDSAGVGEWSVMGGGSWNMVTLDGDSPAFPDAWLKWYQGWITPTQAVNGQAYALDSAHGTAEALLLGANAGGVDWDFTKHSGTGEFFLVENRQLSGYDAGLPACGLLIWHIDETRSFQNDANADENRQLVHLEQADGLNQLNDPSNRGDGGDPYPGSSNNKNFNDTSNPNSRFYNGTSSNHALTVTSSGCAAAMNVTYSGSGGTQDEYHIFLPVVVYGKPAANFTGRVTLKGAAAANQTLKMYYTTNNWSSYSVHTTTKTNASGNYAFNTLPPVGNGKEFAVQWENPDASYQQKLVAWICTDVQGQVSDKYTCSFDIQDVALSTPVHNASVNLPYTFKWVRRTTTSDKYEVDWWDPGYGHYMWTDPPLGYVGQFTLTGIPGFFVIGFPYNWTVYPLGSNGNGVPFYYRWVTFNDRSSPPREGVGSAHELLFGESRDSDFAARYGVRYETPQPRPEVEGMKPR